MKRVMACMVVAGVLALVTAVASAAAVPGGPNTPPAATDNPSGGTAVVLPDAASAAIKAAFPNATMGKVSAYGRGGMAYSVAMTDGDKKFSVNVNDAGVILSVNTPIAAADLPKVVADAATAGGNGAAIDSVSKIEQRADRQGKALDKPVISYEVRFVKGSTPRMLRIAEDGTVPAPRPRPSNVPPGGAPQ